MRKVRCCNCGHVFSQSGSRDPRCPSCGSNALESLSPLGTDKRESSSDARQLLQEVPSERDNLAG